MAIADGHRPRGIVGFPRHFPAWRRAGQGVSFPSRGRRHDRPAAAGIPRTLEFPGHSQNPSIGVLDCPIYLPACRPSGCGGRIPLDGKQPSADISTAGPIIPGWPDSPNGKCSSTPEARHSPSDSTRRDPPKVFYTLRPWQRQLPGPELFLELGSDLRPPTSDLRLPTSDFRPPKISLRPETSLRCARVASYRRRVRHIELNSRGLAPPCRRRL